MVIGKVRMIGFIGIFTLMTLASFGQCPQLFDFYGNPSSNPYWYTCNGNNYTLNLQSPNAVGNWTVDWGDGSPMDSGPSLVFPSSVSHLYPAAVDTFIVVFTDVDASCSITGVLVMEEATSASIQIPIGGLTQACAPQSMDFINSSTNVSENTIFTWDFGDNSPLEVFDYTNWGDTIAHTYERNTVSCETTVTLIAENYCNTVQGGPSQATFNPIRIWDLDTAQISPSDVLLCWPENTVSYVNTSLMNCFPQGNIAQRYEYWNFGDYWGLGYDSIVDWSPWPPPITHTLSYPGIGSYTTMMLDSNFCGIDTAYVTIQIVPPPTAGLVASDDTVCVGEVVNFINTSDPQANSFSVNFDDGLGWIPYGGGPFNYGFNLPGDYSIGLTASIAGATNCIDTTWVPITVLPGPTAAFNVSDPDECDSLTTIFADASTGAIAWNWNFGNTNTSILPNPPPQDYIGPGTYNVVLQVTAANGCQDSEIDQVIVYESPVANFLASNVCQGDTANFLDITNPPGEPVISWNWDFGDAGTSTFQNPNHVYATTGLFNVSLTVSTANCSDDTVLVVTSENIPIADFVMDVNSGCAPLDVNFTNNSSGAATYLWQFGDGQFSSATDPSNSYANPGVNDTTYAVSLISSTAFGCRDTSIQFIDLYHTAIASFSHDAFPGCAPLSVNFTNGSIGASSYSWNFGDATPIDNTTNPSHLYINNTPFVQNFVVTLVAETAFGCNDTITQTIVVYPTPNFTFDIQSDSGCSPLSITFPNINGAVDLNWDFGDLSSGTGQNPNHTYYNLTNNTVNYQVELIASNAFGCIDSAYSNIDIFPQPTAQFNTNVINGCTPLELEIENLSILADSVHWNYGDGDTSSVLANFHNHTYYNYAPNPVTYNLNLEVWTVHGCSSSVQRPIQIYPAVNANFTSDTAGCTPLNVQFTNQSTGASSFNWNFGNGFTDVAVNPSTQYLNPTNQDTTYYVEMVATSFYGCTDTINTDIEVFPLPQAQFTIDDDEGCSPFSVEITNNSLLADNVIWNYGDASQSDTMAAIHDHIYSNPNVSPQNYTLTLITETNHGCSDTQSQNINVFPGVNAAFYSDSAICSPAEIHYQNQSSGAVTFNWNFNGQAQNIATNPIYTYINNSGVDQVFTTTLIATSIYACSDTVSRDIIVHTAPTAGVDIASSSVCYPLDVVFENTSTNATSYYWDYDDGFDSDTMDVFHQHTFTNSTTSLLTYNVSLVAYTDNGCMDTAEVSVQVIPPLEADFEPIDPACNPLEVNFENNSNGALTYFWDFGDGFTDVVENPNHTFSNYTTDDATFTVTLIVESYFGCTDTITQDVLVYANVDADFTVDPIVQTFPNATVNITNLSTSGVANYTWDWGDNNSSTDPNETSYTYGTYGQYTITLTIDNDFCSDEATQVIQIIPPEPIANFSGGGQGCAPVTVQFQNESLYGETYSWNFGDGGTASNENPTYTYFTPGIFTVSLIVSGPGGSHVAIHTNVVEVFESANAYFTANPSIVTAGNPVFFYNLSNAATEFQWDFGDGDTSTEANPEHVYQEPGSYAVTLIANNINNCPDTFRISEPILIIEGGSIEFPNAFTPNMLGTTNGQYDPTALDNDVFFPVHSGVIEYELQIFTRWGEAIFESREVQIGWDGYYKGQLVPQGVYVWKVKAKFNDGSQVIKAGDLTLLR